MLSPALIDAMIWQESRGNPKAVSPRGAAGLMQIMPETARDPGFGVQPMDWERRFDPDENKRFGTDYMGALLARYDGDQRRALAAYNWGAGNADKWSGEMADLPTETRDYITRIEGRMSEPQFSKEDIEAEMQRRGLLEKPQFSRDEVEAEMRRRGLLEEAAPAVPTLSAGQPTDPNLATAAGLANDYNAGFQRVNPVSVSKAQAIGVLKRGPNGEPLEIVGSMDGGLDGPVPGWLTPDKFVTQVDPATGRELIYRRTEEMGESPLASAGRVLGVGALAPTLPLKAAKAAQSAAVAAAPAKADEMAQAFKEAGVTPALGMKGRNAARLAGALEATPTGGGVIAADAKRALGEIEQGVSRVRGRFGGGGVTALEGGQSLRAGADSFLSAFEADAARRYARVGRFIGQNRKVDVTESAELLKGVVDKYADTPNIGAQLGVGKWAKWLEDFSANNGQMTWEALSELRSDVGRAIGKMSGPLADQDGGRIKQVYAALTRDMEAAAKAAGPKAHGAWKNANAAYQRGRETIDGALDLIFKSKSDEAAFESLMQLGRSGTKSANLGKLREIKKAMPDEQWREVAATVIAKMGDKGGEFNAAQFATNWGKMTEQGLATMFTGKGVSSAAYRELRALVKTMNAAKDAGVEINRSRSGAVLSAGFTGTVGGGAAIGFVDPVFAAVSILGPYGLAKVSTNVGFLRAMNSAAKGTTTGLRHIANAAKHPLSAEAGLIMRVLSSEEAGTGPRAIETPIHPRLPAPSVAP